MLVVTIFFIWRVYKMAIIMLFSFLLKEHPQFWNVIRSEGLRSSGLNASNPTDDDKVRASFTEVNLANHAIITQSAIVRPLLWCSDLMVVGASEKTRETNETWRRKNRGLPVVSIQSRLETSRSFCVISLLEFVLRRLCIQTTGF